MKVFGHRGFSGEYPENTMLAYKKAVEAGCDGIELDVQLTRDLVPVLIHDESVDRTSNGSGYIHNMTYDELTRLDFSYTAKFGDKHGFQKIPTLEEYFEWVVAEAPEITTNVELKNSVYYYAGLEKVVLDMIYKYKLKDRIILSSFNNTSVARCKEMDPDIACGFLIEGCIENAGAYARDFCVEYYHPRLKDMTEEHVLNCSQNGIGVNVWTVNEEEDLRRMKKWGVRSVITNFPDVARKIADERI